MNRKLFLGGAALCAMFALSSCDELMKIEDETKDGQNQETTVTPEDPSDKDEPAAELKPSEQKVKLQEVGQEIMDMCPASEFETLSAIAESFANSVYASEDYDWGTVEEWFETELDDAYSSEEKVTVSDGTRTTEWIADALILMSDHTGLFTLTEDGVVISDYAGGTKAVCTLNGKTYEAEITSEGKVTNAIYAYTDEYTYTNSGYYDENDNWVSGDILNVYKDKATFTVGVPEKINVSVSENGSPLLTLTAEFTPSFSKEGIDLTTDSFATKITAAINGYERIIEKAAYNGETGKTEYSETFKKDGTVIYSAKVSGDAKIEEVVEKWEDSYSSETYTTIKVHKAQNIVASVDIIGQIQVYGKCSDGMEAYEELDAMYEELSRYDDEGNEKTPNENEAQRHMSNFNTKFDLNVYYDGGSNKQAGIEFEIISYPADYDRNGDGLINNDDCYYDIAPVIVFNDGSRYKVEEYFTEDSFSSIIESFEAFCNSFAEVIGFEE